MSHLVQGINNIAKAVDVRAYKVEKRNGIDPKLIGDIDKAARVLEGLNGPALRIRRLQKIADTASAQADELRQKRESAALKALAQKVFGSASGGTPANV